jgi:outer membrane lipoprotein SlyB
MRKTYEATKQALTNVYNTASEEVGKDLSEINQKIIAPTVELGKNRVVSTIAGGKLGLLAGAFIGPVGMVKGAIIGAAVGAIGGPPAMNKISQWLGTESDKNAAPANDDKAEKPPASPKDPAP